MTETPQFARFHERVLALGGVFQALALVQQVARSGVVDSAPFATSIESVLRVDAPSTEAVYGGRNRLQLGLQAFSQHLEGSGRRDVELARYWLGVLALERKLSKQARMLETMAEAIPDLAQRAESDGPADDGVVLALAQLYRETISTLTPRIMVSGEPRHLSEDLTANRIRALLLSAIRSAVLWRQVGGTRLGLLFSRAELSGAVREILDAVTSEEGLPPPALEQRED